MSHMPLASYGVTTSRTSLYQRTNFDNEMNKKFNPMYGCIPTPYESFSYRSNFDKAMLNRFDPEYKSNQVREAYRTSKVNEDPFMPWSYRVLRPDIN